MTELEIILPFPHKNLSPNSRKHWCVVAKHKKQERETAFYITKESMHGVSYTPNNNGYVNLIITFQPEPRRSRGDIDNYFASLKAAIDGISDAIGIDDKHFRPTLIMGEPVKGGRVIVTIG